MKIDYETQTESSSGSLYVRHLYVANLFGQYTYDLSLESLPVTEPNRLLILYGDNGSGKTTLLKLVFNLLGHGTKSGHRSFIFKIPFRELLVELGNGIRVSAKRTDSLVGPFVMQIERGKEVLAQVRWISNEQGKPEVARDDRKKYRILLQELENLRIALYLLSDDRRIRSNRYPEEKEEEGEEEKTAVLTERAVFLRKYLHLGRDVSREADGEEPLEDALRQTIEWATQQVLRGSSKGNEDAHAIYTDVIQRIATAVVPSSAASGSRSKEELVESLQREAQRTLAYSRFGLTNAIEIQPLIAAIQQARDSDLTTISNVINPYIDGIEARLNALQHLHDSIDSFCRIINSFYRDKEIMFDLKKGPEIKATSGAFLAPSALSSGERQLLLLFCNILVARDMNSIFIIDEPELSLNVKWQRNLVNTLVDFTKDAKIQFLLATHSIELLARHRDHVLKLDARSQS